MDRQVFEMSEVADIVGAKLATVKNWTIGRPLRITPSIRIAEGAGRSNLYSREDIYRFALANELHKAGMTPKRIAEVLNQLRGDLAQIEWIRIWRHGKDLKLRTDRNDPPGAKVWQTVHLSEIIQQINEKL